MADHNSMRPLGRVSFLLSLALATAPALAEEPTTAYSLYRTSAAANVGAVYMATFDADTPSGFCPVRHVPTGLPITTARTAASRPSCL